MLLHWPAIKNQYPMPSYAGELAALYDGGKARKAHRVVCEAAHGTPEVASMDCCHARSDVCHGKACCNPAHLRWCTRYENIQDQIADGSLSPTPKQHGEANKASKLTDDAVREIRASKERGVDLAKRFGVTQQTISNVRNRRGWTHVQ